MTEAQAIEVLVVSPHDINRLGIRHLIDDHMDGATVMEERAEDGDSQARDVVVYDVSAGFEAAAVSGAKPAHEELPHLGQAGVPVVVVAPALRPDLGHRAVALGAVAAVTCDVTAPQLLDVLKGAATGHQVGSAVPMADRRQTVKELTGLSAKQLEVLELIATGHSNQEITEKLGMSLNTLKSTIRLAYRRVGVTSRSQAVLWAVDVGLAVPAP